MTGRDRIRRHAGAGQPTRRWVLDEGRSGTRRDSWTHVDGYRVEASFTRGGAVRAATLTAPNGQHRYVVMSQEGKADKVIDWLENPAAATLGVAS